MTTAIDSRDSDKSLDFIRAAVAEDVRNGRYDGKVVTRFPPEPNGYLHIGHTKAMCLNFGVAAEFGGVCNLRFDDTNPVREEQEYVDAICDDIRWLGFDWGERICFASDYFDQLYEWAVRLIEDGLAYVDDQSADETRENRGTLTEPGKDSPHRDRSVEENTGLFGRMKAGEFPDGARVLRAKTGRLSGRAAPGEGINESFMHLEITTQSGDRLDAIGAAVERAGEYQGRSVPGVATESLHRFSGSAVLLVAFAA